MFVQRDRRWLLVLTVVLLVATAALAAQSPVPAFAAASVRPNSGAPARTQVSPDGRFIAANQTLRTLIQFAYGLREFQLAGPAWIDQDRFDVDARAGHPLMPGELQLMVRTLLAERFKLTAHTETREAPMLELVAARADGGLGAQIRPADPGACTRPGPGQPVSAGGRGQLQSCATIFRGARITGRSVTMDQLANSLSNQVALPIVNRTGIMGVFDLDLDVAATSAGGSAVTESLAALTTAVQEQLGLRLNAIRGPANVMVVDNVAPPTPD